MFSLDGGGGVTKRVAETKIFKDNTITCNPKFGGGVEIKCKKGLWSVIAPTLEQAEREATHYFVQYFEDGEYAH